MPHDLAAVAAEHAAQGAAERRLAEPVVEALRDAGLFRALVPSALGGLELEPQAFLDAVRVLAKGDAAAAWIVAVCEHADGVQERLRLELEAAERGGHQRAEEPCVAQRLDDGLGEALRDAGLRALVPSALGGLELEPQAFLDAVRVLEGDAAAAWIVAVCGTGGMLSAYLEPEAAREIYGDGQIAAGVFAPRGRAVADGDDLVVTGRWSFASGSAHADWLMVGCLVGEGDHVERTPAGAPDVRLVLFPRAAFTVHDTWDVAGLRGTGSNDISLDGARAPRAHSASLITQRPVSATALHAFPAFGLLALSIASVTLGIARGAIGDLAELAGGKTPTGSARPLAARADTQSRVARGQAAVDAAQALVAAAVAAAWATAQAGTPISVEQRSALRRAATHATEVSARVTSDMYALGGGTSVYASSPLQRRHLDVHVATQHALVSPATWELAGRLALGLETDVGQL